MPTIDPNSSAHSATRRLSQAQAIALWKANRGFMCLPTTIEDLDRGLGGGLPVHQITMILGPTGAGKSEIARQFRRKISMAGTFVFHVDVELGPERIIERDMSQTALIPAARLRGDLTEIEKAKLLVAEKTLTENEKLFTYHPQNMESMSVLLNGVGKDVEELCGKEQKPALVIFDSLQRLAAFCPGDDQRLQVQNLMWALEAFSKHHNIAVLVISEQARPPYGKKHTDTIISSGAESRAIEFVSDVVIGLIQRGESSKVCHDASMPFERKIDLDVAKNRNGDTGVINSTLVFKGPCWELSVRPRTIDEESSKKRKGKDDEPTKNRGTRE